MASKLKPWRDVIAPHPDVASGRYVQAEFAADLAQVLEGRADPEYQDPVDFFNRTYLTAGMRGLLRSTLNRLTSSPSEDYLVVLAGQRQWIATTNCAGCPGRPQIALRIAPCSLPRQSS